mgnify:CR=1 FL=1
MSFNSLPGFRDFYPEDCQLRNFIFNVWRRVCRQHNFAEYDAPILQPTELFTGKSGAEIVGQLFNFTDKGGREVTLRPEMTPYVCQMVAQKAQSLKRPIKWFSIGEFFRYERQQKGRLRSFYQLNADIFDEADVTAEVELLALVIDVFRAFGLTQEQFAVRLSDRTLWLELLAAQGLNDEQSKSALQIVDKWEREEPAETKKKIEALGAKGLYETLSELMKIKSLSNLESFISSQKKTSEKLATRVEEWKKVLADLKAMGYGDFIQVDLGIVRGLAYYTGFVFEVFQKSGEGRALAGGGRYDNLVEKVGGPKMAAFGMGLGDVTLTDCLRENNLLPQMTAGCDMYMIYTSDATRAKLLEILPQLRMAGMSVEMPLKSAGFGKLLKAADKAGARHVLILGDDELTKGAAKMKNLASGEEREIPLAQLLARALGE